MKRVIRLVTALIGAGMVIAMLASLPVVKADVIPPTFTILSAANGHIAYSQDGKWIAIAGRDKSGANGTFAYVNTLNWQVRTLPVFDVRTTHNFDLNRLAWTPDSKKLLVDCYKSVAVISVPAWTVEGILSAATEAKGMYGPIACSPTENLFVGANIDPSNLLVSDRTTGATQYSIPTKAYGQGPVSWTRDGKFIIAADSLNVDLIDTVTKKLAISKKLPCERIIYVTSDPSSKRLAVLYQAPDPAGDPTVPMVWVQMFSLPDLAPIGSPIKSPFCPVRDLFFTPDGDNLLALFDYFIDSKSTSAPDRERSFVSVWDAKTGALLDRLGPVPLPGWGLAIAPDGKNAVVSNKGQLSIWSMIKYAAPSSAGVN